MQLLRFLTELARRRVLRLAGFYIVGAWLLLQVADVTFEPIGMPDWAMRYLIYLVVSGFFLALVLGWRYDITSEGLVRAGPGMDSNGDSRLGRRDYLAITGLSVATIAIASLFFWRSLTADLPEFPQLEAQPSQRVIALAVVSDEPERKQFITGVLAYIAQEVSRIDGPVLLTGGAADFLDDNRSEVCELLEAQSGCEIAFVEDSLSGTDGLLTIRLVDAWSGNTIRTKLVHPDEDDSAKRIAQLCDGFMTGLALPAAIHSSVDCDGLLLSSSGEALFHFYAGFSRLLEFSADGTAAARQSFSRAIEVDPGFGAAFAGLGISLLELVKYPGNPLSLIRNDAWAAIQTAEELAPKHWITSASLGYWHERTGDYQAAADAYSEAVGTSGGSAYFSRRLARIHEALNDTTDALAIARRVFQADRFNAESNLEIGSLALRLGDRALAGSALTDAVTIDPSNNEAHTRLADLHYLMGRCEDAESEYGLGNDPESDTTVRFAPENLDFESGTVGWQLRNDTFTFETDSGDAPSGKQSVRLTKPDAGEREAAQFWQEIRPCTLQGKRIRLTGFAKTHDVSNAFYFYISARASPKHHGSTRGRELSGDFMNDRQVKGTTGWTKYELVIDVPVGTMLLYYGAILRGPGSAWIDDLEIEEVDESVPTTG